MAIRFENGIVATLGSNNQVLWNGSVVTDGENVAAVGDAAEDDQVALPGGLVEGLAQERGGFGLHHDLGVEVPRASSSVPSSVTSHAAIERAPWAQKS